MKTRFANRNNDGTDTDEWLTPPYITDALGPFELDVCAVSMPRLWDIAPSNLTKEDDGLTSPWDGFAWCNPPYRTIAPFLQRMAQHNHGIALTFARTETRWFFQSVWHRAKGILFLEGRLHFCSSHDGKPTHWNAGAPSCLIGYGDLALLRLQRALQNGAIRGKLVTLV